MPRRVATRRLFLRRILDFELPATSLYPPRYWHLSIKLEQPRHTIIACLSLAATVWSHGANRSLRTAELRLFVANARFHPTANMSGRSPAFWLRSNANERSQPHPDHRH